MSVLGTVTDLQNQTAFNSLNGSDRNVGGVMGKHDFLMLLAAQLRHQDPLEPQSDADFAAGLAQFSSLEQMQNMNNTLTAMTEFQNFGLVGKHVLAEAMIGGEMTQIIGPVDSVFTSNGVTFAHVNGFDIPLSAIREVFDASNLLTADMLHSAANSLIGRIVIAEVDGEDIEGIVTRVFADKGSLVAQIQVSEGEYKFVPVNTIVDIRELGTEIFTPKPPKPQTPPDAQNFRPDGDGFIEVCESGVKELGRWDWSEEKWQWVFTKFNPGSADGENGENGVDGENGEYGENGEKDSKAA